MYFRKPERTERLIADEQRLRMGLYDLSRRIRRLLDTLDWPIVQNKDKFFGGIRQSRVLIISAETGAGKSTIIPLLSALYVAEESIPPFVPKIAVTVPRKIAASGVANFLRMNGFGDNEIGYTYRHESSQRGELINYMTDGYLLKEDPQLDKYNLFIIDEAHERSSRIDLLFGLAKNALINRPDWKLVIMSATIDVAKFENYFAQWSPKAIQMGSSQYPVEINYLREEAATSIEFLAAEYIIDIHQKKAQGDILVFFPGEKEIFDCGAIVKRKCQDGGITDLECHILHSNVDNISKVTEARVSVEKKRRVILSTNIAESSVTIKGVKYVLDSGLQKQKIFDPKKGFETFLTDEISKNSATQRAGRAGRTQNGICFRLYTAKSFDEIQQSPTPEILRSNLIREILDLKAMNMNFAQFDFIDKPAIETVRYGLLHLHMLDIFGDDGQFTNEGRMISRLSVDPRVGKMLLEANKLNCLNEALALAAMMESDSCFAFGEDEEDDVIKKKIKEASQRFGGYAESDHWMLVQIFLQFINSSSSQTNEWCKNNSLRYGLMCSAYRIYKQLHSQIFSRETFENFYLSGKLGTKENLLKAVVAGFRMEIAEKNKKGNIIAHRHNGDIEVRFHPSSYWSKDSASRCFVYQDCIESEAGVFIRTVSAIDKKII